MSDERIELIMNRIFSIVAPPVEFIAGLFGFFWRNTAKWAALAALVIAIRQLG